jgi:hypothetical protein
LAQLFSLGSMSFILTILLLIALLVLAIAFFIVASSPRLSNMSSMTIILQIGACLCVLVGALYGVVTVRLLIPKQYVTILQAVFLTIYTLSAFVPLISFGLPRLKTPRKQVFLSVAVIEILVLGLFLWNIFLADDR